MAAAAASGGNDAGCDAARQKDMNHRINGLARAVSHEEQLAEETDVVMKPPKHDPALPDYLQIASDESDKVQLCHMQVIDDR
ncbi:hypothetical protein EYF80_044739 [Liparis tanakae]|uniref:Uncharacterized protein n=1 Tax=Liparis tanakae TaxID=230148 RepID=A0A4Z2FV13_9TELE|nr:hypothetical protein EYF80_044739 [Liparis tanakae]